jgi:MFS family permease
MRALRPLRHREFRLLWAGLAVSLVGDGLWLVALAWQVIELDGGPLQLSLVTTAFSVGLIGCILVGGVVADRVSRRRVMLAADLVRLVVTVVVGLLALGGALELWQLAIGAFLVGSAEAFFVPAFTALVPQLLPEDELLAANGLEGVIRPLALQALGPGLGGLIVAAASPGDAMLANGASYAISVLCLWRMRPVPLPARAEEPAPAGLPPTIEGAAVAAGTGGLGAALEEMREGWRYVRGQRWLWATLLFACIAILFLLGPIEVLLPFAVRDQTGGGADAYGLVLAVYGIGGAAGALLIASRRLPRRYLTVMLLAWGVGSAPVAAFGYLEVLWAMVVVSALVGVCDQVGQVIWGTLMQRRVPAELQGRVASLDWFVSLGLLPVSMALAGPAAELVGVTAVFVASGVACATVGLAVLFGLRLRQDELAHPLDVPATGAAARAS